MAIVTADLFPHSGSPDLSIDTKNEGTALRYHRKVWPASSGGAVLANNKAVVEERDQGGDGRAQHKMYMNGRKKHARARRRKGERSGKTHTHRSKHAWIRTRRARAPLPPQRALHHILSVHTHTCTRRRAVRESGTKRETPSRTAQRLTHTTQNRSQDVREGEGKTVHA